MFEGRGDPLKFVSAVNCAVAENILFCKTTAFDYSDNYSNRYEELLTRYSGMLIFEESRMQSTHQTNCWQSAFHRHVNGSIAKTGLGRPWVTTCH